MLTSKERAELRSQANLLETILTVGKGGVTEQVLKEAEAALDARELIKCQVLETSLLTAREASDAICEAIGADGVQCIGRKFVIYRKNPKKQNPQKKKPVNPVRKGVQARRRAARKEREKRNAYFKQAAVEAAKAKRQGK